MLMVTHLVVEAIVHLEKNSCHIRAKSEILNKNWMFAGFPCSEAGESPVCAGNTENLQLFLELMATVVPQHLSIPVANFP